MAARTVCEHVFVASVHVSWMQALWLSHGVSSAGPQQPFVHSSTPLHQTPSSQKALSLQDLQASPPSPPSVLASGASHADPVVHWWRTQQVPAVAAQSSSASHW